MFFAKVTVCDLDEMKSHKEGYIIEAEDYAVAAQKIQDYCGQDLVSIDLLEEAEDLIAMPVSILDTIEQEKWSYSDMYGKS